MAADLRPNPPWWIDRARERRFLLDGAVRRLRRAVRNETDLVGALVFGSYAEGRVGPESDLDLIVITTLAADGDPGGRYAKIAKRLALGVPCDLIVYESDEFQRLACESSFVARTRRTGLWIDATTPD